ncbi:MAG: hypothetical protein HUJ56_03750 [Erysipelotrichaceae bacterium]|nr:hypothetical protein [Erysipelotrichaceae bacterium]
MFNLGMRVNITAGEELNKILKKPNEVWIPFNEAMIKGGYKESLFSRSFNRERALVHGVSVEEYEEKLKGFLTLLQDFKEVEEIYLFFGDEPFCEANYKVVIQALRQYGYKKKLVLNLVDELTGEILQVKDIDV